MNAHTSSAFRALWSLYPIVAIVYGAGEAVDPALAGIAGRAAGSGVHLAGLVQHELSGAGHHRCEMEVEILPHGKRIRVSQDRGPSARGCRLDQGLLVQALALAARSIPQAGLVILNRFGKIEAEGGGGRALIAEAVGLGIPVLMAVPWRNIEAFRAFADGLALEVSLRDVAGLFPDHAHAPGVMPGLPKTQGALRKADGALPG